MLMMVKNSWDLAKKECVSSSGVLTGLDCLEFDHVLWLVAVAVVLPHLQIELLQVHCVLLGVEQGTADSLFPNTCSDHFQAARKKNK